MTREIPVTQARADLADLVNRVAYSGERIMLTRHGKPLAALVPVADLDSLEHRTEIGFGLSPAAEDPAETAAANPEPTGPPPGAPPNTRPGTQPGTRPGPPLRIAAHYRSPHRRPGDDAR